MNNKGILFNYLISKQKVSLMVNSIDVIEFISRGFGGNLGQPNNASKKVLLAKLFYFENL